MKIIRNQLQVLISSLFLMCWAFPLEAKTERETIKHWRSALNKSLSHKYFQTNYALTSIAIPKKPGDELRMNGDVLLQADEIVIQGPVYTEGYQLTIITNKLRFQGAGILHGYHPKHIPNKAKERNCPPPVRGADGTVTDKHGKAGRQGEPGNNGTDGKQDPGMVRINASVIEGASIRLEGQKGGDGGNGCPSGNGGNGAPGGKPSGRLGPRSCGFLFLSCIFGSGRQACIEKERTSGANGGDGGPGGPAAPGGNGGSGGKAILLHVSTTSPRPHYVSSNPGEGGKAGLSGEPGKGGKGGVVPPHTRTKCEGNVGTSGGQGPPGSPYTGPLMKDGMRGPQNGGTDNVIWKTTRTKQHTQELSHLFIYFWAQYKLFNASKKMLLTRPDLSLLKSELQSRRWIGQVVAWGEAWQQPPQPSQKDRRTFLYHLFHKSLFLSIRQRTKKAEALCAQMGFLWSTTPSTKNSLHAKWVAQLCGNWFQFQDWQEAVVANKTITRLVKGVPPSVYSETQTVGTFQLPPSANP